VSGPAGRFPRSELPPTRCGVAGATSPIRRHVRSSWTDQTGAG
jgi:hypothetical protein